LSLGITYNYLTGKDINNLNVLNASNVETPATSPNIDSDELSGKTKEELEKLAEEKGLVKDPKNPDKYRDPETGKERLLIHSGHVDPRTGLPYDNTRAANDHVHGFDSSGRKIGDPSAGNDPHFPIRK
jgi:hypothetical protein